MSQKMDHYYIIQQAFYRLRRDFVEDFSFFDIRSDVEDSVFSRDECDKIMESNENEEQVDQLFFQIIYKNKNVNHFIDMLSTKYDWLADGLKRLLSDEFWDATSTLYHKEIQSLSNDVPTNFELNVHRLEYLWDIQQKIMSLNRDEYLIVHGSLLFGKRWLALDACSNYLIMEKMNFKIFWLNVGKCLTDEIILEKLRRLHLQLDLETDDISIRLTNYDNIGNKIYFMKQRLKEIFSKDQYKDCLIVLANVQNDKIIKAFNLQCKIMITTRNKEIIDKVPLLKRKTVQLSKGFNLNESLEMFSKVLHKSELPLEASEIHSLCIGNPFIISLIAGNLQEFPNTTDRWCKWKETLTKYRITDNNKEYNHLIKKSLIELPDEYKKLFQSLVIFNDNVNIPISLLQKYWKKTSEEVEIIVNKLDKMYLVEANFLSNGAMVCLLKYHYYSYLTNDTKADEKLAMHRRLVDCYDISAAFENRQEPNIVQFPHDGYFHFYIAYHLKEANMIEMFPKLFLDFGFLEQKLRATGLPNTLSDLKMFQHEIIAKNKSNMRFLKSLFEFLPNVEEMISKSDDTCLLQYAITTNGIIKDRAKQQAKQFPNRIWLNGKDHTLKHRQIVPLPNKFVHIKFIDPDTALLALIDHTILLSDLSTYNMVEPTMFIGHKAAIKDIQPFLDNYFISLDVDGVCKVWSMNNTPFERRRTSNRCPSMNSHRRARKTFSATYDERNISKGQCIQTFDNGKDVIQTISLINRTLKFNKIIAGTKDGRIVTYEWNTNAYKRVLYECFNTKSKDIQAILHIAPLLILLDGSGKFYFFNLKNHREMPYSNLWRPQYHPISMHQWRIAKNGHHTIIAVFKQMIISIRFNVANADKDFLFVNFEKLYECTETENSIVCCRISDDGKYFVLGTRRGIIVYDINEKIEILRSHISEQIIALDLCALENSDYKHEIISGTKESGAAIIVNGLDDENDPIQWSTNRIGSPINENNLGIKPKLTNETNAWLKFEHLFVENINCPNDYTICCVDSLKQINRKNYNNSVESTFLSMAYDSDIKALSFTQNGNIYVGCENGLVYQERDSIRQPIMTFMNPIQYLVSLPDAILASTQTKYKIKLNDYDDIEFASSQVVNAFQNDGFLLIVKIDCSFDIFKIDSKQLLDITFLHEYFSVNRGCDFKNDCLIIAAKSRNISIWQITSTYQTLTQLLETSRESQVSCVRLSENCEFFAIGYENGQIDLYEKSSIKYVFRRRLISNKKCVNDLLFSPSLYPNKIITNGNGHANGNGNSNHLSSSTYNDSVGQPIILVSIAEQICFWNVTYAINNSLLDDNNFIGRRRSSQRYSKYQLSQNSLDSGDDVIDNNNGANYNNNKGNGTSSSYSNSSDELSVFTNGNGSKNGNGNNLVSNNNCDNLWSGKYGASSKPELLSCIKFVGNSAKHLFANQLFTKFITIDDEGEIYDLNVVDISNDTNNEDI